MSSQEKIWIHNDLTTIRYTSKQYTQQPLEFIWWGGVWFPIYKILYKCIHNPNTYRILTTILYIIIILILTYSVFEII